MSTELRGHHLICLQFYRGEGYSGGFVTNLQGVRNAAVDTPALVVSGPDDVCAKCPGLGSDGTCRHPETGEAEALRIDSLALQLVDVAIGESISLTTARARLAADPDACNRWRDESCATCLWQDVCKPGWDALLAE